MDEAPPLPPERNKRGCWFIGCSILFVVILGFSAIAAFVIYKGVKTFDPYLATAPLAITPATVSDEEFQVLQARIAEFTRVGPGAPSELALSAADWNALIARRPEWKEARGRAEVMIEGDALSVQSSIPLDAFPGMDGKFMNGRVFLEPAIADSRLRLPVRQIDVSTKPMLPEAQKSFGTGLQGVFEDLLAEDPILKPVVAKARSVSVRDGAVVFSAGE